MRLRFLIVLLIFSSCDEVHFDEIDNLSGGEVLIYGHGGLGFDPVNSEAPPNTYEAVDLALNGYGIDGVEIDIQMLSDGTIVLFHDLYMEGKTNCSGVLRNKTWNEVSKCKYRNAVPGFQSQYKIARLEDVLNRVSMENPDAEFSLHVRTIEEVVSQKQLYDFDSIFIENLVKLLDQFSFGSSISVESGDLYFLEKLKLKSPELMVMANLKIDESTIDQVLNLNLDGFVTGRLDETSESVALAHDSGLYVSLFGLTTSNEMVDAFNKSPDFVQVDNVRLALQVYHNYK